MKGFGERMLASAEKRDSRVVLALDVSGKYSDRVGRAEEILEATKRAIAAVKLNHQLLLPFGLEGLRGVIATCRREGLPLIADLKMNDIESTNIDIVDSLKDYGIDAVVANPFVGREEGLGEVVERVHSVGGGILFLVYMSHKGAEEGYALRVEGGEPLYKVFAKRAKDWGADGVIVSAKDSGRIGETRKIVGSECLIFSPGVGAQGGSEDLAIAAGSDFVIVGRSITESKDPEKTIRQLNER